MPRLELLNHRDASETALRYSGAGCGPIVVRTLNILGIAVEEDASQPARQSNPVDQFWIAACEVFTEIVKRRPDIQTVVGSVVDAGGDIEITAHNQPGKISLTLADSSGDRHVVLEDARQVLQYQ